MTLPEIPVVARQTLQSVPEPPTTLAAVVMRSTLIELAVRWGYQRHAALRALCLAPNCEPASLAHVAVHCQEHVNRPREMFVNWIDEFCREVEETHREQLARRVAKLITASATSPLNVARIAAQVNAHEASIRRAFYREFHMSLRQYHTEARMAYVEQILSAAPDGKIEPIGIAAGWHSKKGFYKAVLRTRGCTPGALRARVAHGGFVP